MPAWREWNKELAEADNDELPRGLKSSDVLFINNGHLSANDAPELPAFERANVEVAKKAGMGNTQLVNNDTQDRKIALDNDMGYGLQPFSKDVIGVLETTGGLAMAAKACQFALYMAKKLGVKFVLHPQKGKFSRLLEDGRKVVGIETADGTGHQAAMTIIACGGWTPTVLPQLDGLCETTAGSVAILQIPEGSPLRDRFHHSRFPSWAFKMRDGAEGGLYGFPADGNGHLKIGYRGTKYTNPQPQADGVERSVPITRWTEKAITGVPDQAIKVIEQFLKNYLPELGEAGIGIWKTRLCWYTDSFDNHYVIDHVPDVDGLMVATGGSGHAFKYLPNIGNWVVDRLEGVGEDRPAMKAWKWRDVSHGGMVVNQLMEGKAGPRVLGKMKLALEE
jgi:sarcosine oxidase/L-pipecolate oxidase